MDVRSTNEVVQTSVPWIHPVQRLDDAVDKIPFVDCIDHVPAWSAPVQQTVYRFQSDVISDPSFLDAQMQFARSLTLREMLLMRSYTFHGDSILNRYIRGITDLNERDPLYLRSADTHPLFLPWFDTVNAQPLLRQNAVFRRLTMSQLQNLFQKDLVTAVLTKQFAYVSRLIDLYIHSLNELMLRAPRPDADFTVYRGVSQLYDLNSHSSFVSCTCDLQIASQFAVGSSAHMMSIRVLRNTPCLVMWYTRFNNEREILLPTYLTYESALPPPGIHSLTHPISFYTAFIRERTSLRSKRRASAIDEDPSSSATSALTRSSAFTRPQWDVHSSHPLLAREASAHVNLNHLILSTIEYADLRNLLESDDETTFRQFADALSTQDQLSTHEITMEALFFTSLLAISEYKGSTAESRARAASWLTQLQTARELNDSALLQVVLTRMSSSQQNEVLGGVASRLLHRGADDEYAFALLAPHVFDMAKAIANGSRIDMYWTRLNELRQAIADIPCALHLQLEGDLPPMHDLEEFRSFAATLVDADVDVDVDDDDDLEMLESSPMLRRLNAFQSQPPRRIDVLIYLVQHYDTISYYDWVMMYYLCYQDTNLVKPELGKDIRVHRRVQRLDQLNAASSLPNELRVLHSEFDRDMGPHHIENLLNAILRVYTRWPGQQQTPLSLTFLSDVLDKIIQLQHETSHWPAMQRVTSSFLQRLTDAATWIQYLVRADLVAELELVQRVLPAIVVPCVQGSPRMCTQLAKVLLRCIGAGHAELVTRLRWSADPGPHEWATLMTEPTLHEPGWVAFLEEERDNVWFSAERQSCIRRSMLDQPVQPTWLVKYRWQSTTWRPSTQQLVHFIVHHSPVFTPYEHAMLLTCLDGGQSLPEELFDAANLQQRCAQRERLKQQVMQTLMRGEVTEESMESLAE